MYVKNGLPGGVSFLTLAWYIEGLYNEHIVGMEGRQKWDEGYDKKFGKGLF